MKRGQKRSKAQKKRDARYLRWRNLRDAFLRLCDAEGVSPTWDLLAPPPPL